MMFTLISSCNDPKEVAPILFTNSNGEVESFNMIVLNEGNFGSGSGTVSKVNLTDSTINSENRAYFNVNNDFIGNVVQSMIEIDDELWVVINNSQKIVRCDKDLNKLGEITGFVSPRYLIESEEKVYVSDLFSDSLSVVSKTDYSIVKRIYTGGWNEELLVIEDELWVTDTDKNTLSIYSTIDEQLITTIKLVQEPFSIRLDASNKVWVLCNGGLLTRTDEPYLYTIDPETYTKTDSVNLSDLEGIPTRLSINESTVYVLSKHLYQIENQSATIKINGDDYNFYNAEVIEDNIFLTDAKDFVRNGDLHRFKLNDITTHDSVELDVIPGFIFKIQAEQ